jgi:hypothetical protein
VQPIDCQSEAVRSISGIVWQDWGSVERSNFENILRKVIQMGVGVRGESLAGVELL